MISGGTIKQRNDCKCHHMLFQSFLCILFSEKIIKVIKYFSLSSSVGLKESGLPEEPTDNNVKINV